MMNNQDDTQEEKTVVFAGYEEDTGASGELPLNHDPWAAAVGGLPGLSASATTSNNQQGQAFAASRRRFTGNKILMFAAVVLAVLLAFGGGFYALMSVEAQHAAHVSQVQPAVPNQRARPAPAPTATPALTPVPTPTATAAANVQPAAPNQQQQNNPPPAVLNVQDNFQRNDQAGSWGKVGNQKWKIATGDKGAFSVANGAGFISTLAIQPPPQAANFYTATIGPATSNTIDASSTFTMQFNGQNNMGITLRWEDGNNYYKAYVDGTQLVLMKKSNGQQAALASFSFAAQNDVAYTLRFRSSGSALLAKVWQADQQEPVNWMIQAQDTDLTTGKAGIRALLLPGDTIQISSFQVAA